MHYTARSELTSGVALLALAVLLAGCDRQNKGFALPEGDAQRGADVFVELGCNACHSVDGIQWTGADEEDAIFVKLGGKVTRIQTYNELISSIINPSHKLSRGYDSATMAPDGSSRMRVYNDVMTVQQLIDLVMFLQPKYDVAVPRWQVPVMP